MEEVIEDKNIELAYETFFQIERRIEKHQLYKKSVYAQLKTTLNQSVFIIGEYNHF